MFDQKSVAAPARARLRVDLADMLRRMRELEADAVAMPGSRKAPALDDRHVVRHVGVRRIVGNRVDAGLRDDLARPDYPPEQS
jgi:hypothetical protein